MVLAERFKGRRYWLVLIPAVLVIALIGAYVRYGFVLQPTRLVIDEKQYMPDNLAYADLIQHADLDGIINYRGHYEHPPFVRILYGLGIALSRNLTQTIPVRTVTRGVSAGAGILLVALLAGLNPFAGLFLALHSTEAVFTSRAYLEAVPAFTSAVAIVSYVRFISTQKWRWFYLAAIALGVTAASKYIYLTAGLAILPFLLWQQRRQPWHIAGFGLVAFGTFLLFNPYLWNDPLHRELGTLQFSMAYTKSAHVIKQARPWWYEVAYLAWGDGFADVHWGPTLNTVIFVLGWLGLPVLYKKSRVYALWFLLSFLFLLIWPTKWNQYSLIFITPMCLAAGYLVTTALQVLYARIRLTPLPQVLRKYV